MSDNFSIHKITFNKKIELDSESSNRFETQVRELLKKYPLANRAIKDLLKTEKTFNNSLGYIYEFLEDVYKNQQPFIVIKIGKLYKIPKEPFDKYLL